MRLKTLILNANETLPEADIAAGFSGKSLSARREWIQGHVMKHIGENETDKRDLPVLKSDLELLPTI